jgi:hypothetical protein
MGWPGQGQGYAGYRLGWACAWLCLGYSMLVMGRARLTMALSNHGLGWPWTGLG